MPMVRLFVAFLALSCLLCCSREPEPLRLGAVLSVTGPAGYLGEPEKNTLHLLVDELNAKGGVDGRRVELVLYDDASDVTKSIQAAIRLIEEDRVAAVVGPSTSGNALAIRQLFSRAGIPLVACAAAERIVRPVDPWIFTAAVTDHSAARRILADARRRGFSRLALLTVDDGFGQAGREVVRELARSQGLTLAADEVFGASDTDLVVQYSRVRDAAPQAVICWSTAGGAALAARTRAQLGLAAPLYMSHAVSSDAFLKLAGDAAEGILLPACGLTVVDQLPGGASKALLSGYVDRYVRRFGKPPTAFGGHAYDAFMLVASAVHSGASVTPRDIRDNLERIKGLAGMSGIFALSPENHNGLDEGAFRMVTVEHGRWRILD